MASLERGTSTLCRVWMRRLAHVMLSIAMTSVVSLNVHAQSSTSIAVNAAGLMSIQPVDSTYVGPSGPYLNEGLGGVGPGFAMGLNVITHRIALVFEYSMAWLSADQQGRLVPGGTAHTQLHDAMLTALVGTDGSVGPVRSQLLAGISQVLDDPTANGASIYDMAPRGPRRQTLTVGLDVTSATASRMNLVATLRVSPWVGGSPRREQLGIGNLVVRAGVGARIQIGSR